MIKFEIKEEKPPIWDNVCAAFKIIPHAIFTYGKTIYNPDKIQIPHDLIEHEKVHMEQQNYNDTDAALWWGRYLREESFRLDQEARAYGRQYAVICQTVKDRNIRSRYLVALAMSLSGPLYNKIIEHSESMKLIKHFSGVK